MPQMTKWRTRISCWIPKATNTHSEYVILIVFSNATMVARTRLECYVIHALPLLLPLNLMVYKVTTTVSTVLVIASFTKGNGLAVAVCFRYVTSATGEGLLMSVTRENAINLHSVGRVH